MSDYEKSCWCLILVVVYCSQGDFLSLRQRDIKGERESF